MSGVSRPRVVVNAFIAVVLVAALAWEVVSLRVPAPAGATSRAVPQSVPLEQATGVRFSRIAVVGDGGLLTVSYVVLDPEKATEFQSDRDNPPRISSDDRRGGTQRASIMRAGHQMRAGQTYYLVYENTTGAVRAGGRATVTYAGVSLHQVPVL